VNFAASKVLCNLADSLLSEHDIELWVKREDLVHRLYGGNKFRKLRYNLQHARENNFDTILTFGGSYSNHIAATAFAGKHYGFTTIGIIRGEELYHSNSLSTTLHHAKANGMHLRFISRNQYRDINNYAFHDQLRNEFGNIYIIPEGGANLYGMQGCMEIVKEIEMEFNYICCPAGTGTTLTGIAKALKPGQIALGIEVYKNENPAVENLQYLKQSWEDDKLSNAEIFNYSFGGYGKVTSLLQDFCNQFYESYDICIEPVYSGKMFYGIFDLVKQGYFKRGSVIIAIHTGGLQYLL
jgi:1-aminocyclopropane-1-carboxylate deaminase/D-cysteine desulfhydrase-like pyridoxal-dependent ACC family enzyme